MVEAWRLNKHSLYEAVPADKQVHLFLIFTDNDRPDYETVKAALLKGIEKLAATIQNIPKEGI